MCDHDNTVTDNNGDYCYTCFMEALDNDAFYAYTF